MQVLLLRNVQLQCTWVEHGNGFLNHLFRLLLLELLLHHECLLLLSLLLNLHAHHLSLLIIDLMVHLLWCALHWVCNYCCLVEFVDVTPVVVAHIALKRGGVEM